MRKRPVVHTPAGKKNDQFFALVIDELHFHCFIISVPLYKCIKIFYFFHSIKMRIFAGYLLNFYE